MQAQHQSSSETNATTNSYKAGDSRMKERPILFNAEMVRAILEGRKTVTRRPVKVQLIQSDRAPLNTAPGLFHFWCSGEYACPYGEPGQRLWVRETWFCDHFEVMRGPYLKPDDLDIGAARDDGTLVYAADGRTPYEQEQPAWKPSIHMPRWASRILLEITDVRVERLQDISDEQALAEGVTFDPDGCMWTENTTAYEAFKSIWFQTSGIENWQTNPWVWVIEFKRVMP